MQTRRLAASPLAVTITLRLAPADAEALEALAAAENTTKAAALRRLLRAAAGLADSPAAARLPNGQRRQRSWKLRPAV